MLSLQELMVMIGISASASEGITTETFHLKDYAVPDSEVSCLADNVYFEARNQGTAGWAAVIAVTLNRVDDNRFPDTVCEVVKQGPHRPSWKGTGEMIPVRHRCQFSWYCDGKSDTIHSKDELIYKRIEDMSYVALLDNVTLLDITDGATHYHADYVRPSWAKTKTKTVEIGDHIFYRWDYN